MAYRTTRYQAFLIKTEAWGVCSIWLGPLRIMSDVPEIFARREIRALRELFSLPEWTEA